MNHPMPENMGFALPRSISEMLPDEPLVEPERRRGRYGKDIHVSLIECTCAACGERFTATAEHRYKQEIKKHGKSKETLLYCSYNCFRPVERAAQEKFKKDTLNFVPDSGRTLSPVDHARARVEKCRKKLEGYEAIRKDPQAWDALPRERRRTLTNMIARWKQKLDDAQEALETLKEEQKWQET